jgi:hypothetical protein
MNLEMFKNNIEIKNKLFDTINIIITLDEIIRSDLFLRLNHQFNIDGIDELDRIIFGMMERLVRF